jgi:hypothetical protein
MKLFFKQSPRIVSAALLVAALWASGCGDGSSNAKLRVLHASPDAPNVDINLDGKNVLTNVAYKTASDYLNVKAGAHTIKVYPTGTTTAVITANVTLLKDSYTTVAAVDFVSNIQGKVLDDNNTPPVTGNIKLRLFHAAPSAGNVDIYVTAPDTDLSTATPNLTDIPFLAVSDYISTAAGTYRVRITPTGTKTVAIDSGSLTLTVGQIRTAVAIDNTGGGAPFGAIVLNDLN